MLAYFFGTQQNGDGGDIAGLGWLGPNRMYDDIRYFRNLWVNIYFL